MACLHTHILLSLVRVTAQDLFILNDVRSHFNVLDFQHYSEGKAFN